MPVGSYIKGDRHFTNTIIKVQPDDTIYMASDGIANQIGGDDNKPKFSSQRLRNLLETIAAKPFAEQRDIIENTLQQWRQRTDGSLEAQIDDQILVGVRI